MKDSSLFEMQIKFAIFNRTAKYKNMYFIFDFAQDEVANNYYDDINLMSSW